MRRRLQLSPERRQQLIAEIQHFFESELDQTCGQLKAQLVYDFVVQSLSPDFYNLGIKDSIAYLSDKLDDAHHLQL